MISRKTKRFRKAFEELPQRVQSEAREVYALWRRDPYNRSLHFKKVHPTLPVYSIRIGLGWRALAMVKNDTAVWYWIGSHAEYDTLFARL